MDFTHILLQCVKYFKINGHRAALLLMGESAKPFLYSRGSHTLKIWEPLPRAILL